ncbi:MAG TPA: twin-arginine translocation signal domain-containing protein, partial [Bacteroidales bacterium]|nr:twin-arginine translocation signal domain-containing protein [Bacteroidales bacterium]
MKTRRDFLKLAGTGVLAAGINPLFGKDSAIADKKKTKGEAQMTDLFGVGMAGFTFARFNVEKTIEMMNRIGVKNLSLKEFH